MEQSAGTLRLHHGTDLTSANDLLLNGVDQGKAATFNGTGEFWASTDASVADWFALAHPSSPPAARFEFDLPVQVLRLLLGTFPPAVTQQGPNDYEFLPTSFPLLNLHLTNRQVVPVP